MILRFFKLNETNLCDINWDGLVLVGIELGELVEGLHGELFGVSGLLGGPSPSPGPSLTGRTRRRLLTGVLCHTPAYTSTPAGLHSAPVEEPGGTRGLVHLWCTCSGASSAKPEMQLDQICTGCLSTDYIDPAAHCHVLVTLVVSSTTSSVFHKKITKSAL